jgi:hypothetical protein
MDLHNVFHVSLLKKYVHDINHVASWKFDLGGARRRVPGLVGAHIGREGQNAP